MNHDLMRALMSASADDDEPKRSKLAPDIEALRLRDSFTAFNTRHEFQPGMIVRQKPGASIYQKFGDNDHAIVIALLGEPVYAPANELMDCGRPYFRMPLDMLIGAIECGESGEKFAIFHVDSRRFEPVPEHEIALRGMAK